MGMEVLESVSHDLELRSFLLADGWQGRTTMGQGDTLAALLQMTVKGFSPK